MAHHHLQHFLIQTHMCIRASVAMHTLRCTLYTHLCILVSGRFHSQFFSSALPSVFCFSFTIFVV